MRILIIILCIMSITILGCTQQPTQQSPSYLVVDQVVSNGKSKLVKYNIDVIHDQTQETIDNFWFYDTKGKYNVHDTLALQVLPIKY